MFEYTKKPYESSIEGVENVETGWKITSDIEGRTILEEHAPSADTVDGFLTNMIVPIGTSVYVWYKMVMNNGEVKDYVGPTEFVSREDNVTSDLQPITRVKTPYPVYESTGTSTDTTLVIESSEFHGDPLDGHLASTWIVKDPNGKILFNEIFSTDNRYLISLDRIKYNLSNYDYVTIYLKHHSANGTASDFGILNVDTAIYPFKYSGLGIIDYRLDYTFSIVPTYPIQPNLEKIEIVNVNTGDVSISFTSVSSLSFTIPANTLDAGSNYEIRSYVLDTASGKYPEVLVTKVVTKEYNSKVKYDTSVNYDLTKLTEVADSSVVPSVKLYTRLVNNKAITVSGGSFISLAIDKTSGNLTSTKLSADSTVNALINIVDKAIYTIDNNKAIVISRSGVTISVDRLVYNNNSIAIDSSWTTITTTVSDINHNLETTTTLAEDDRHLYYMGIGSTITTNVIDLYTGEQTILDARLDLTTDNYDATKFMLQATLPEKIISLGGPLYDWYWYITDQTTWVPKEELSDNLILKNPNRGMLLADRSILLPYSFTVTEFELDGTEVEVNKIHHITKGTSTVLITNTASIELDKYNIMLLDSAGVLHAYSSTSNTKLKLTPM